MKHASLLFSAAAIFVLLARPAPAAEPAAVWVKRNGAEIALGNDALELWFSTAGKCRAVRLVNRLSGRTIPLASDDLSIGIEGRQATGAAELTFQAARDEATADGRRLVLHFTAAGGVAMEIVYELGRADFFLRRHLELTTPQPLPLRRVDLWRVGIEGKCAQQGFGEPVLLDDTFWGVEFPAGHNEFAAATVTLSQFPGRTVAGRFVSKGVVLGVAERGETTGRFLQYVDSIRVTPRERKLFVNYNTFWTLSPPTEENSLALVDLLRRKLWDRGGASIDAFTMDEGWDDKNSLWAIRGDRFPHGFAPLVERLAPMKARLGIWLSPSSSYGHAAWLAQHGYQAASNPWFICQSDPSYRRDLVAVVAALEGRYGVGFFKFDGFFAACDAAGHAHRPGPFGPEANVDAYIELLTAVRRARPDIYLDLTCGMWLSPWWLQYADSIWGEVGGDYPDRIVPAPGTASNTTTRDGVYRQRCRERPGFPTAAIEHLGIIVIAPQSWEDDAAIVVGRGARLLTLYINPGCFLHGDRDWEFLGRLLQWVRFHAATLEHTALVLGDPLRGEPYGYAHFLGVRGILALRNPLVEKRTVTLKLDQSAGWRRPEGQGLPDPAYAARIVYPRQEVLPGTLRYGQTLTVELQGFETMLLEVEPRRSDEPLLVGARGVERGRAGNRVTYALAGWPGEEAVLVLPPGLKPLGATLDGRPIELSPAAEGVSLPLHLAGRGELSRVEKPRLERQTSAGRKRIVGSCTATVPEGTVAAAHVLFEPARERSADPVQCHAQIDGKAAPIRGVTLSQQMFRDQAYGPHHWAWFEFDVPPGRHEIAFVIDSAKSEEPLSGRLGWWLWSEHRMTKGILTVQFSQPLPPARAEPSPPAPAQDLKRQILAIEPLQQ
jgi:hypothetical protein